ncbi:hypothetical protein [Chitinimonas taiwanensis]|nr:hypothetical protein [Chitinimonas taiwanensis]
MRDALGMENQSKGSRTKAALPPPERGQDRPLTPLEKRYIRLQSRIASLENWVLAAFSLLILVTGLVMVWAVIYEASRRGPEAWVIPFVLLFLGVGVLGALLLKGFLSRRCRPEQSAHSLDGVLKEEIFHSVHPKTGARSKHYRYKIGDVTMIWPPGARAIYQPFVDQHIQLTVVYVNKTKPVQWFGEKSALFESSRDAVVLAFKDLINIQGLLTRYGSNYFERYFLKQSAMGAVIFASILGALYYVFLGQDFYQFEGKEIGLAILGVIIGLAVIFGLASVAIKYAVGVLKLKIDLKSHEEKLKG